MIGDKDKSFAFGDGGALALEFFLLCVSITLVLWSVAFIGNGAPPPRWGGVRGWRMACLLYTLTLPTTPYV